MIKSRYATQLTRDTAQGKKNPQRNMANRMAQEAPLRKRLWEKRLKEEAANSAT